MAMTKRDFENIAEVISEQNTPDVSAEVGDALFAVTEGIADYAAETNERFDRQLFYRSCGFESPVE